MEHDQMPSSETVAERVIQLFSDHGIYKTQIPIVFPSISLDDVSSTSALIQKLTPELISDIATFFNVRAEWLLGVDDKVYSNLYFYKRPNLFFELLEKINAEDDDYPLRIISCVDYLNYKDQKVQPLILVVLKRVADINDEYIYRYYLDDQMDWSETSSRIQIKAMAKVFYEMYKVPIPIYKLDQKSFDEIAQRKVIPTDVLNGFVITDPSLEDYFFNTSQSGKAKDCEELPAVQDYIREYKLEEFAISSNRNIPQVDPRQGPNKLQQSLQQRAGFAKNEPTNQLKRECIKFWLHHHNSSNKPRFSNNQCAIRFYDSLQPEKKILLTPTNAIKTLSLAISQYRRREVLKASNKLPNWLKEFTPEN